MYKPAHATWCCCEHSHMEDRGFQFFTDSSAMLRRSDSALLQFGLSHLRQALPAKWFDGIQFGDAKSPQLQQYHQGNMSIQVSRVPSACSKFSHHQSQDALPLTACSPPIQKNRHTEAHFKNQTEQTRKSSLQKVARGVHCSERDSENDTGHNYKTSHLLKYLERHA